MFHLHRILETKETSQYFYTISLEKKLFRAKKKAVKLKPSSMGTMYNTSAAFEMCVKFGVRDRQNLVSKCNGIRGQIRKELSKNKILNKYWVTLQIES